MGENKSENEAFYEPLKPGEMETALLVGIQQGSITREAAELSLAELDRLVDSAGGEVLDTRLIQLRNPRSATLISRGHLEDLTDWVAAKDPDLVVIDAELSPVQQRNVSKALDCHVVTRTEVILDIFATHATTRESMTQVELAQLRYLMPRLIGASIASARMGGVANGIATRGPGETQLEVDRRRIRRRIRRLEETLKTVQQHRETQRRRRMRSGLPLVGIVGYTNAGKSTLLNRLTQAGVLAEDQLFCTLDTTVRNLALPSGLEVGLIDTVGFVDKLPTTLVAAFRATLEEVAYADVILHVVDATSPRLDTEFRATQGILEELNAAETPRLIVWNKCDLLEESPRRIAPHRDREPSVRISALEGEGIDDLLAATADLVLAQGRTLLLRIPYDQYDIAAQVHREAQVIETRDTPEGQILQCRVPEGLTEQLEAFAIKDWPEES